MDMGFVRGLITLVLLVLFIGLCAWAWSRKRKKDFEEAAELALDEEDRSGPVAKKERPQ